MRETRQIMYQGRENLWTALDCFGLVGESKDFLGEGCVARGFLVGLAKSDIGCQVALAL